MTPLLPLKEAIQKIVAEHGKKMFEQGRADNRPMICGQNCPERLLSLFTKEMERVIGEEEAEFEYTDLAGELPNTTNYGRIRNTLRKEQIQRGYMNIEYGFELLPDRKPILTSQEEDHIKVLKGKMKDIDYFKKWEVFDL